jgi:hypothetical protein
MDAEYVRQVCALMRWDAGVLVPPPSSNGFSSNAASGANATHPNNAGYAVLSFASAGAAAAALPQVGVCRLFYPFLSLFLASSRRDRRDRARCSLRDLSARIYASFSASPCFFSAHIPCFRAQYPSLGRRPFFAHISCFFACPRAYTLVSAYTVLSPFGRA